MFEICNTHVNMLCQYPGHICEKLWNNTTPARLIYCSHANLRDLPHLWVVVRLTFWSSCFPWSCASFCIGEYKISASAPLGICVMTAILLFLLCSLYCCLYYSQSKNVYKAFTGRSLSTPAFNYRSRRTLRRAPWWSHAPLAWRLQRNAHTLLFWRGKCFGRG